MTMPKTHQYVMIIKQEIEKHLDIPSYLEDKVLNDILKAVKTIQKLEDEQHARVGGFPD